MTDKRIAQQHHATFEEIRQFDADGNEFWSALDLAPLLEYQDWRNFMQVVDKARLACGQSGRPVDDHFGDVTKMVPTGSGAQRPVSDVHLSRYAWYLIVQNGDPRKEVIDEFCLSSDNKTLKLLYQKVLPILNNNLEDDNDWKILLIKFEQKHTNFFKKLKILYPELTPNDLKLCACLKLNLETKDIASLMNLSTRSVENNRYRLRKKLNLRSTQNLNDFILNLD